MSKVLTCNVGREQSHLAYKIRQNTDNLHQQLKLILQWSHEADQVKSQKLSSHSQVVTYDLTGMTWLGELFSPTLGYWCLDITEIVVLLLTSWFGVTQWVSLGQIIKDWKIGQELVALEALRGIRGPVWSQLSHHIKATKTGLRGFPMVNWADYCVCWWIQHSSFSAYSILLCIQIKSTGWCSVLLRLHWPEVWNRLLHSPLA